MLDSKKISSKDFQNSCRFCLEQKNPLTDIPAKSLEILEHILEVKFTDDEHLPTKACEDCAKEMESCSQFIEKCKNSYSALLAAVEEGHDKLNYQSSIDDTEEHNYDCEEKGNEAKAQAAHSSTEKYRNIIVDEDLYRSDYQKKNDKIIVERAMHYSIDEVAEIEFIQCKEVFSTDKQWLSTLAKHKVPHSNKPIIREQTKSSQENKKSIKNFYKKIKDENGKLKFQCTLCNRVLNTHSAALSHMNIHTGEKPFTCEFCGKKFTSISSVNIHKRQHTGETPYKCRVCNRGFRSSSNRKKHEDVHHFIMKDVDTDTESHDIGNNADSDIDKVECDICKKKINKHGFGVHRKSHLNEKKQFICTYCNKEFQKNSHLERHLRIHTGERPYTCEICNKSFIQDGDLKRHIARHTGAKQYQCQHCGAFYTSKTGLENHVSMHLGEQYQCHHCGAQYVSKTGLQQHVLTHFGGEESMDGARLKKERRFLCVTCGKGYTSNNSLKEHILGHTGETPYKCEVCGKGYTNITRLKYHTMRQHSEEKPHGCVICNKHFFDSGTLKRHIKRVHLVTDAIKDEQVFVEQT